MSGRAKTTSMGGWGELETELPSGTPDVFNIEVTPQPSSPSAREFLANLLRKGVRWSSFQGRSLNEPKNQWFVSVDVPQPTPSVDSACSMLMARIERASEAENRLNGAKEIDEIREVAEEVARTGEAYLRDLLLVVPVPEERSELPVWAKDLEDVTTDAINARARESLFRVLRSLPSKDLPEATVSYDTNCVRVTWHVPNCLSWVVSPPKYRWPSVNVRVHSRISPDRPATKSRTILLAHRLIADAEASFA